MFPPHSTGVTTSSGSSESSSQKLRILGTQASSLKKQGEASSSPSLLRRKVPPRPSFTIQYTNRRLCHVPSNKTAPTLQHHASKQQSPRSLLPFREDLNEGSQLCEVLRERALTRQRNLLEDEKRCKFVVETPQDFIVQPVAELKWRLKSVCVEAYFYHRRNLHLYRHHHHNTQRAVDPLVVRSSSSTSSLKSNNNKSASQLRSELKEQTHLLLHDVDAMFKICSTMLHNSSSSSGSSGSEGSPHSSSFPAEEDEEEIDGSYEGAILAFRHVIDQLGSVKLWKSLS